MKHNRKSALTVMAGLGILLAGQKSGAATPTFNDDLKTAGVVSELIDKGLIEVNESTGRLSLKGTIVELLKESGVLKEQSAKEVQTSGACSSTGENGGCT